MLYNAFNWPDTPKGHLHLTPKLEAIPVAQPTVSKHRQENAQN